MVTGTGMLLAAKLVPPPIPRAFVDRPRLLDRLDAGVRGEVTLLCAGPGSGKTSLIASWVAAGRAPGPVAWLSLDAFDNTAAGFWSYLLGALVVAEAVPENHPLRRIRAGARADEPFLRRVAVALAALPAPVVLVLDDLHEVHDPGVLSSLAFLLRHPVAQLRLVVTTRNEPALPLHRPRLRTATVEIREAELDFTADESDALLAAHRLVLTPAEARAVHDRAEGWATGLVLAARLLVERGPAAGLNDFTGSERTVAEYLTGEVLAGMPAELRQFLQRICLADRVCGDLADALTGGTDGHATLEKLVRANVMVTAIESAPGWFRAHALLAGLLRHTVRTETPALFRDLHRRAADWFAEQDAVLPALGHAIAAQDWKLMGRLVVTRAGPRIVSADRGALVELLSRIPPHELSTTAGLELCSALLAYDRADYRAVVARVARARALLGEEEAGLRTPIEILARSMDAVLARERGDMAALVEAATDTLRLLLQVSPAQLVRTREYRSISLNMAGVGFLWTDRPVQAEEHLRAGMAMAEAVGAELTQLNATSHLALLEAERGDLCQAHRYATRSLDLATNRGWRTVLQVVPAYAALAMIHLDRDDLDEAEAAVEEGLAAQRGDPEPIQLSVLRTAKVRLLLVRGEVDAARLLAGRMTREIGGRQVPPLLVRWLSIVRAELELAAGSPRTALGLIERAGEAEQTPRLRICAARAQLALGAPRVAEAVLAPIRRTAPDVGVAVETWVASSLVADALRQGNRSVDALGRAVALAEPQNLRRPFITAGPHAMAGLLERYQWLAPRKSPFVAGLLTDLSRAGQGADGPEAEGLTDRELDVLRYLPTMLKNHDIAAEMYVSVNTVKAHLRALYRKLGVTQRREAVERARELGLL
jgi:LuxR family transcriptional regulator, maltose regulon positive regulatory protein